jgi:hypothetical protein
VYCVSLPVAGVQCFFCTVCLLDMYLKKLVTRKIHQTQTLSAPKVLMSIIFRSKWQFLDCVLCVSASSKCAMLLLLCVSAWDVLEKARYMKDTPNTDLCASKVLISIIFRNKWQFVDCVLYHLNSCLVVIQASTFTLPITFCCSQLAHQSYEPLTCTHNFLRFSRTMFITDNRLQ